MNMEMDNEMAPRTSGPDPEYVRTPDDDAFRARVWLTLLCGIAAFWSAVALVWWCL